MSVNTDKRERRDWTLIIFLLPIGIVLMLVAGQIAIRVVPYWRVAGGMGSSLDPETASKQQGQIQPILFDIQTPMAWFDTFLTPQPDSAGPDIFFPPFVVFEPSETPPPTASPSSSNTPVAPTVTPPITVTSTPTPSPTKKPPKEKPTNKPPQKTPSPSPLEGSPTPAPIEIDVDAAPDNDIGTIPDGYYVILTLPSPIVVKGPSDKNYDLVYYEQPAGTGILMDSVILSISKDNTIYYVVFNWGDGIPDTNSNVGDVAQSTGTEYDNQPIDSPVDDGQLHGTAPLDTGILVDVDNAPSNPPKGNYSYLAIQAPAAPAGPAADSNLGADSVQVVEVPPAP